MRKRPLTPEEQEKRRAYQREWQNRKNARVRATETAEEREARLAPKRAYSRERYRRDPQRSREQNRKWLEANREKSAAYQREYRQQHRAKYVQYLREYRERNRERLQAKDRTYWQATATERAAYEQRPDRLRKSNVRRLVREAVRLGILVKPDHCEGCGAATDRRRLHGHHHRGYDHPLDVQWLCPGCHGLTRRTDPSAPPIERNGAPVEHPGLIG